MNNEFVVIPEYPSYEINRDGSIRNIETKRILIPLVHPHGYIQAVLYLNKKGKRLYVHRLVASIFIPNPNNLPTVNHKNGVKADNRLENLEWCTFKENKLHAVRNGLVARGEDSNKAKLNKEKIKKIRELLALRYTGQRIARLFNVSDVTISLIKRGKIWKHI